MANTILMSALGGKRTLGSAAAGGLRYLSRVRIECDVHNRTAIGRWSRQPSGVVQPQTFTCLQVPRSIKWRTLRRHFIIAFAPLEFGQEVDGNDVPVRC